MAKSKQGKMGVKGRGNGQVAIGLEISLKDKTQD